MESVSYDRGTSVHVGRRWPRFVVPAGLIAVVAAVVVLIALMPAPGPSERPPEIVPVNVRTMVVKALPELADTIDLTAVVEPEAVVRVAAEVPGRIERYGVRGEELAWRGRVFPVGASVAEGEPIIAGEALVHLNTDLLQARYDRAAAQAEYDEREFRRIQNLFEAGTTSRTELDDARTRRDVSRASLEEAARELERATIVAPLSGVLNRLPMEVGEYATPGDTVAEIVQTDIVKVLVDVPERDVPTLKTGATVQIVAAAPEDGELDGRITYIDALADRATNTTRVEVTVDNRAGRLRSGQIVRARLTRRVLTDVIMIPLACVIPLEDGKAVYVAEDGRAARRDVELGLIKGRDIRVLRGLQPGEQLIVEGHRYVGPGQPVNVSTPE